MHKALDVNNEKWKVFKKWCAIHDTTIKEQIDKFLRGFKNE